jgi:hypothetical protein
VFADVQYARSRNQLSADQGAALLSMPRASRRWL